MFKLAPNTSGGYTGSILYYFLSGSSDGAVPYAGLIMNTAGKLYGTTTAGGSFNCGTGCGTVFEITPY